VELSPDNEAQLELLRELEDVFGRARIRVWLRGGWALDFLLGRITRAHADIDVVTWLRHKRRLSAVLRSRRFQELPSPNPRTQAIFTKDGQELSILFVTRRGDDVVVPGFEPWPFAPGSFGDVFRTLHAITCRVLPAKALIHDKERHRGWSGRPLRAQDRESLRLLRELTGG
jgi:aminoglycoside-2''-adenylyltransferase